MLQAGGGREDRRGGRLRWGACLIQTAMHLDAEMVLVARLLHPFQSGWEA